MMVDSTNEFVWMLGSNPNLAMIKIKTETEYHWVCFALRNPCNENAFTETLNWGLKKQH